MADEKIVIQNVVVSSSIDTKIPLSKLAMQLEGSEYEPETFPGLVARLSEPKAAALVFKTGKIVCTGTNSPALAKRAIDNLLEKIKALGVKVPRVSKIDVQNMVASTSLGKGVNLNRVAFALENVEYEPETFPGLVYRLEEPEVVFLIFSTGKIICTGGTSRPTIEKAVDILKKKLKEIGAVAKK